jgi:hypothetical protein
MLKVIALILGCSKFLFLVLDVKRLLLLLLNIEGSSSCSWILKVLPLVLGY